MSKKRVLKFWGDRVEMDINDLIPYELNNKDHPEKQVNLLSNMIDNYGYVDEILIDKNNIIIAGHGRLEAIKKMWYDAVEVKRIDIDSKDARAFRLFHNKVAEMASNNMDNIHIEVKDLGDYDIWTFKMYDIYPELKMPDYDPSLYNPNGSVWGSWWSWWWDPKVVTLSVKFDNQDDAEDLKQRLEDEWYEVSIH